MGIKKQKHFGQSSQKKTVSYFRSCRELVNKINVASATAEVRHMLKKWTGAARGQPPFVHTLPTHCKCQWLNYSPSSSTRTNRLVSFLPKELLVIGDRLNVKKRWKRAEDGNIEVVFVASQKPNVIATKNCCIINNKFCITSVSSIRSANVPAICTSTATFPLTTATAFSTYYPRKSTTFSSIVRTDLPTATSITFRVFLRDNTRKCNNVFPIVAL